METCLCCGAKADYTLPVLPVRTLPVRDLTGEKRVQALGEVQTVAVCAACAEARLAAIRSPWPGAARRCAPFGAALVGGVVLLVLFWGGEGALRLLGLAALACGVLGLLATTQEARRQAKAFAALPEEKARQKAAWLCARDKLPAKAGDEELSYIPLDGDTLAMKDGDLMVEYKLLPAIARQAYRQIHGDPGK